MSHKQTAYNLIKKYGFKGAAVLNSVVVSDDKVNKTRTPILDTPKQLLAYVDWYPTDRINGTSILKDDRIVQIALDNDFDGYINENDTLTVEGQTLKIVNKSIHRAKDVITFVEVQARG